MFLVIQQLKELVGEYRQAMIVNGQLMTINNKIIYCKRNKHTINFVYKERNGEEAKYPVEEIDLWLHQKLTCYDKFGFEPTTAKDIKISICKATNLIVIVSKTYITLCTLAETPTNNIQDNIYDALSTFLSDTVINYYELYSRVLRPKISRIPNNYIKAHLVQDLYLPIIITSKDILSPFDFEIFRNMYPKLISNLKQLSTKSTESLGLKIYVIAGCDLADLLGISVIHFVPAEVQLALLEKICHSFNNEEVLTQLYTHYSREYSILFPEENSNISQTLQVRQYCFNSILQSNL